MTGESGGAMIMARDLEICRFGHIQVPSDLTNLSALGLIEFDFHPHFGNYGATPEQLKTYSQRQRRRVYAVSDGGGLSVLDGEVRAYGSCMLIDVAS